jgi:hypothetical protein
MSTKTVYAMLAIVALAGGVASVTGMTFQTAVADKGGVPNDSALSGPACDNANDRNNKHHGRPASDQGHISSNHNGHGVEFTYC